MPLVVMLRVYFLQNRHALSDRTLRECCGNSLAG